VNDYSRIQEKLNAEWRLEQARTILEMELLLSDADR
jgi:hypothetical protein